MSVAGIDLSTHAVDLVLLDNDTDQATWKRCQLVGTDAFERARDVRESMPARGWWLDEGVVMVAVERPYSASYRASSALMRIQGAILSCLPRELAVIEVSAQEWKRETVGRSNASKEQVAEWVDARWPWPWPRGEVAVAQDAADAYCVAWAARALCERAEAA